MSDLNREGWLGKAAETIGRLILTDHDIPPLRLSVGWPGGGSIKTRVGECWSQGASADSVNQIFISPVRGEDRTVDILATVTHEMIHAIDDCENGHGGRFMKIARSIGFGPKFTSADKANRSDDLQKLLEEIAELLGPFPHAEIVLTGRAADAPKKQTSRMIKVECPSDGYVLRTTQKWIDVGLPTCPCGTEMEVA